MAKLRPELIALDREISRINRQIRQAYKTFGSEGRLPEQYATILGTSEKGSLQSIGPDKGIVRYDKNGIPQISRSAANLNIINVNKAGRRQIKQIGRMQTVQDAKNAMVTAYEKRTGQTVGKSRAARKAAVQAEIDYYMQNQANLAKSLHQMYKLEDQRGGIRFKAHDEIKMMSKGHWTSADTLKEMQQKVDAVLKGEDQRIQTNLMKGY